MQATNIMKKLYIFIFISSIASAAFAQQPTRTWGNFFGGTGKDDIYASCVDPSGNLYVAGSFSGTVDFDPGAGVTQRSASTATDVDAFVAKFNSSGVFQWVSTF